jgi:hypothetical protein
MSILFALKLLGWFVFANITAYSVYKYLMGDYTKCYDAGYAKGYEAGRRAGCREDLPRLKRRRGDGR